MEFKYCPSCAKELPEGANACPYCGAVLKEQEVASVRSQAEEKAITLLKPIITILTVMTNLY